MVCFNRRGIEANDYFRMHVFADLRPYICTFPDCKDELAQFTTRAAWADHELTEHRHDMMWNCPECSEKFASTSDWEQHLHEMHQRIFTGPQLHAARSTASQVQPRPAETEECPLCRVVLGKPRRTFVKHVARHMEEIALMALPRSIEKDSEGSSDSTDQISLLSENPELLATNSGYMSLDTKEDWVKGSRSSINAPQRSLDAENSELQPVENVAEADEERKLQSVKSAAQTDNEKKLPSAESSVKTGGERKPPPPPPFKPRLWICGDCGEGGMSIEYNDICLRSNCGRRKDVYAREYG